MKQLIVIIILSAIGLNLHAQKGKSTKSKYQLSASISNGKTKVESKSNSYKMVFPQLKDRFDKSAVYILTKEGQKLKIGDETTTQWSWGVIQNGSAQEPIPYGGASVSSSVEFSNGGRDVTITTTTTTKGANGTSTSETNTTKISSDGSVERSTTTTNSQETPDDNPDIVVIVN